MPISQLEEQPLTYPVGVADFQMTTGKPFDKRRFAAIPMLLVQGSIDENDSVPEGAKMRSQEHFSSDSYSFEQAQ
ncbi:hypothetical protein [Aestuariibacter salexigens]|uniref:hypothetical protein n=1 Tax=Aestuariibacter salexigens TaxID=226010 RepID=UPI0012EB7422|nr:hypothetical protein [Aestuariibacter salexigens]